MSTGIIKKTILIEGMTCVSCENRIQHKLSNTPGIETAEVSYTNGIAIVTFRPEMLTLEQIEQIIEALDYKIRRLQQDGKNNKFDLTNLIGIAVILFAIYMLANRFGLFDIFYNFPLAKEGMGYGMLLLIGILTSVHCVAMCGGICLSQCVLKQDAETAPGKLAALRPAILYNAGRVLSYTVIGGIVGALGSVFTLSGSFQGILQVIAGVFMVIMGLNMLNIFPALRKLNPRMPKIFARKIYAQKRSNSPLYVGILNGLMPCGPLQAMQIYALSTGSPIRGAVSMFLFSIGTVPLMLTFGALSSILSRKFTNKMMTAGAILILIMGVFMFNNGTSLSGLSLSSVIGSVGSAKGSQNSNVAVIEDGVQTVTTTLASGRYQPITVQKGIPVRWTIKADQSNINGCNNSMVIRKFGITYDFVPGDNIIEFTPTESGTVPYSCWMGMIRSKITVVDDLGMSVASETDTEEDLDFSETSEDSEEAYGLEKVDQIVNYTIPTESVAVAEVKGEEQEVKISIEDNRFTPAVIVVQRGLETSWTISTKIPYESNDTLLFPYYNAFLPLEEGDNTIYLLPDADFDFSSSDYSFFGYVKVVDDIKAIDLKEIKKEVATFVPTIKEFSGTIGGASCH